MINFLKRVTEERDKQLREKMQLVLDIANKVKSEGGRALVVGGFVRDQLLGIKSKDIDLEIYDVQFEKLKEILEKFGRVDLVGESFAVFKIGGIDVSIPRKDTKSGEGHQGFEVEVDPEMGFAKASSRRDFTINALAFDPLSGETLDEHEGLKDLKDKVLRAVDPKTFGDDPLRTLRAAQFASRFGFEIEPKTKKLCRELDLKELSNERVGDEWRKLLLKSEKPSVGLEAMKDLGVLEKLHPELAAMVETLQEPEWHPEGTVWEHTKLAVDKAAGIVRREKLDEEKALVILLAVLCHDLGKSETTKKEDGRIRSHGHAEAGVKLTKSFLKSLKISKKITDQAVPLVVEHQFYRLPEFSDRAIRRLSVRLKTATIFELVWVMEADLASRGSMSRKFDDGKKLLKRAKALEVRDQKPAVLVTGKDLQELGVESGPKMGEIIDKLYEAQLDGEFEDREGGLEYFEKLK